MKYGELNEIQKEDIKIFMGSVLIVGIRSPPTQNIIHTGQAAVFIIDILKIGLPL
jgi:hypothetical protein